MAVLNRRYYAPRGMKEKSTPAALAKRSLAQECIRLRRENLTFPEIAERLTVAGQSTITAERVRDLVMSEVERQAAPNNDQLRMEMLQQADRIFNRALSIASKDTNRDRVPALGMAMKAQERIAALMGLDAPKQTEVKDTTVREIAPATAQDIMAQLAQEAVADLAKQGLEYDPATGAIRPIG